MEVKRLDNNVTANLRSGYSVNNVSRCVNELVLNSLDANSTHITVRVNLTTFRIQVVDDGEGITKTNLEHVGKRYYTNKCNSTHDLEKVRKQFGFKGEALSSIANNAKIIKITSRAWDTTDSQTLMQTFDKTIEGNRHTIMETAQRASGGTTVTVQEFLYNLPVRQKRTKNLEFNEIKENLQKLFLLHPNITFSLRDDSTKKILFSSTPVETVESALQQQIDNLDEKLIKYYSITRGRMIVKILLYLKQYENSKWQMFFVNKLHVKSAQLTSHVNDILSKSALCNKKTRNNWSTSSGGNYMYLFNITCPNSKYHIVNYNEVEFKNLETIYKVIERQLRKIFKTENIWIAEPEKKKKIECNLERRIHLSGFPGAFKATAVRKPGEEIEEEEDEENFVYHPDYKVKGQSEKVIETKSASSVEEPLRLTYSSSSYPDLLRPPYQEDKEVFPSTNYSCSQDNNQKIITMNVKEPLETTSTIGRNYVLNKFLQDNNYNPKICPPNDKFDDQHRKEREYLKELQMREAWILKKEKELQIALEKAQAIEIERKRDIPYLNPNENMKKYHYESNRNDVALAHYYRYKHERKHRQQKRSYDMKPTKKDVGLLWNDTRVDLCRHETFPTHYKFKDYFKIPDVPHYKLPVEYKSRQEYHHKHFYEYPKRYYQKISKIPKYHPNLDIPKFLDTSLGTQENQNDWDLFNFEELDKKSFHFPRKSTRTAKQMHNFAKTVYDSDFSPVHGMEFTLPHPVPEKKKRSGNFFRIRASENTTRLKQYQVRSRTRSTTTTNIDPGQNQGKHITYSKTNSRTGTRTKTRTLISVSRRTTVTTISRRKLEHARKRKSTKKNRRKIRLITNKATNTSMKQLSVNETIIMMEQSIQCTIGNQQNQSQLGIIPKQVEIVKNHNNENKIESKKPKVNIISDVIVKPIQDDNITTNITKFDDDGIIEGTPDNAPFTPWGSNFHSCILKMNETQNAPREASETITKNQNNMSFANLSYFLQENNADATSAKDTKVIIDKNVNNDKDDFNINAFEGFKAFSGVEIFENENVESNNNNNPFNLSIAIEELAENWSFKFNTTQHCENVKKSTDFSFCTTNQNKKKKPITTTDIFGGPEMDTNLEIDEWSRKFDDQGGSYYINKRTGNTMTQLPAGNEIFELTKRPIDLPKGFSPILKETPQITETVSNETKREFHAAVCESYRDDDLDLAHVKWKKHYLQNTDYAEFFKRIYDKRFIIETQELQLPKIRQASSSLNPVAFTKDMFHQLDVLRQYDCKFIVTVWKPKAMIVIFDQHAVHERVRLEQLMKKYINIHKGYFEENIQLTTTKLKPFEVACSRNTIETCLKYMDVFKKFGLDYSCANEDTLIVNSVPECLYNKALRENARRKEKLAELTKLMLYEIVNSIVDAVCFNQWMPPMVTNLINSEACRGAVMFGDVLSTEECGKLITDLALCDLPFQCAHGRPTCAPLFELTRFAEAKKRINLTSLKHLRNART